MAFEKMNQEKILQAMPEDLKRYFKREIERCNAVSITVHYKFAHYLLTKYEAIMDIWLASESTESEIDEIKKAHEFCLKVTDDDIFTIWICEDCKSVIGSFKHVFSGVTEGEFIQYLLAMIEKCPICQDTSRVLAPKGFLLSGGNLEKAMGKPVPETDTDASTMELTWVTLRGMNKDLKESTQLMTKMFGKNAIKNMIKNGRIQRMAQNDKNGKHWDVFGYLTTAELKKYGLS